MAERQKGMGRGLAAILSVGAQGRARGAAPAPGRPDLSRTRTSRAAASTRSRCSRSPTRSASAACSSPCSSGPLAGGRYELIAGERRWRAAQLAELETIPAVVRRHDDAASLEVALIENMAREDLNPVEEARACAALVEELGLTREEVGLRVGRSRVAVSNLIRLLDLPDEALELIERGELTEGHGRALLLADDHADAPPPRPRRRRRRLVGPRARGPRPRRERRRAGRAPPRAGAGRALHPDQEAAIDADRRRARRPRSAVEVEVTARAGHRLSRRSSSFESLDEALDVARRLRVSRHRLEPGRDRARIAPRRPRADGVRRHASADAR